MKGPALYKRSPLYWCCGVEGAAKCAVILLIAVQVYFLYRGAVLSFSYTKTGVLPSPAPSSSGGTGTTGEAVSAHRPASPPPPPPPDDDDDDAAVVD